VATSAVASLDALADDSDIRWDSQGRAHQRLRVDPGQVAEYCGELAAHEKARWAFEATNPLDFNIHYHANGQVTMPAKADGVAKLTGALDPDSKQEYCWMWTNGGKSPTEVDVSLNRVP
jgi:hypothetical protein